MLVQFMSQRTVGSLTCLLIFVIALFPAATGLKRYDGYKLVRLTPKIEQHLRTIRDISSHRGNLNLDFWHHGKGVNKSVDVLVPPGSAKHVIEYMNSSGVAVETIVDDLQSLIDKHKPPSKSLNEQFKYGDDIRLFRLDQFHSYDEIQAYMKTLATMHPHLVNLTKIGESSEKRKIFVMKIGTPSQTAKPAVWIDAGIHAREWIAPATALYTMNQLVVQSWRDPKIQRLLQLYDWFILPSVNPDGYEFTRNEDRLWRKTRSVNKGCDNVENVCCLGCDPNRNWGYKWGGDGTSEEPCSDIYRGSEPFSEPETNATAQFILSQNNTIQIFLTLHSYAQMWLLPYGFADPPVYPKDMKEMTRVAKIGASALKNVYGTDYHVGNSVDLLYPASGASDDWAKGVANISYVYTLELRPALENDEDGSGFILAPSAIVPTARETFEAIRAVALAVLDRPLDL